MMNWKSVFDPLAPTNFFCTSLCECEFALVLLDLAHGLLTGMV